MKDFNKPVKELNGWDVGLVKASTVGFVLFLITVWPAAMDLVHGIHWGWFLAIGILAALRPLKRYYS